MDARPRMGGCAGSGRSLRIREGRRYSRAVDQVIAAEEATKRPLGVAVIASLYLLQGGLFSVAGPLIVLKSFVKPDQKYSALDGFAFTAIGILVLLLARGLWRLRSWARKTVLWLNGVGIALSLFSFSPGTVISIAIQGSILLYLGRSNMIGYFD